MAKSRNDVGVSKYDPAAKGRPAWNAGKQVGAKRALRVKQIWLIRFFLDREKRMRDRTLFDLAINSKLRGCDLVKIKIGSLVSGPAIRARSMVVQQKSGRPVQFEITAETKASLITWLERHGGSIDDYAFPSRVDHEGHLSTRQYARLVDEGVMAIGLRPEEYGTHSLRRTKAALIYKATDNLRAIQILLGHTKIENTVRYLGVEPFGRFQRPHAMAVPMRMAMLAGRVTLASPYHGEIGVERHRSAAPNWRRAAARPCRAGQPRRSCWSSMIQARS